MLDGRRGQRRHARTGGVVAPDFAADEAAYWERALRRTLAFRDDGGAHRCACGRRPEQYGIDIGALRTQFAFYDDRFTV